MVGSAGFGMIPCSVPGGVLCVKCIRQRFQEKKTPNGVLGVLGVLGALGSQIVSRAARRRDGVAGLAAVGDVGGADG